MDLQKFDNISQPNNVNCLPAGLYIAVIDPQNSARHIEITGQQFAIPDDAEKFTLLCDSTQFPNTDAVVIKCKAEISIDNGKTWQTLCAFTAPGNPVVNPHTGLPLLQRDASIQLPVIKNRIVRTTLVPIRDVQTSMNAKF